MISNANSESPKYFQNCRVVIIDAIAYTDIMKLLRFNKGRGLRLGRRTLVMGILNCTPDSFYSESSLAKLENGSLTAALERARGMIRDGADILDVGGESTRPGADYVDAEKEKERVVPLIEAIRKESDIPISVDTRKAEVAEEALKAGADIINDVSALRDDQRLAELVAAWGVPVVLMHMRGTPKTMQKDPIYENTLKEVREELLAFAKQAEEKGVPRESIILDPGIGFGKRTVDNLLLLKGLNVLKETGYPVLVGLSRKSFLGRILKKEMEDEVPPEARLVGSLAANAWAALSGSEIIRVHDVKESAEMVRVLTAIQEAGEER